MLKHIIHGALLLALGTSVFAADYFVVVPVKGRTATAPAESIAVSLQAATLPAAMVGQAYSYNLRDQVFVTGDKALDLNQATLNTSDTLPAGLSLATNGLLAGTPTVKNEAGSSFQVVATYKGKYGQQVYSLVVAGAALQARQISLGNTHTCALTLSGGVKCWGSNSSGQLGNPAAAAKQAVPLDVTGLSSGVVSLSSGIYHTCALMDSGRVKCWGMDDYGQLGDDSALASKSAPIDVSGIVNAKAVEAGGYHTCALTTSDQMLCWGWNASGQLGNSGAVERQGTPVLVTGLSSSISSISAGGSNTCAVTSSGGVKCWGNDGNGQLGDDEALVNKSVPVDVFGLTSGISKVSVGNGFTCALTTSGSVKCWGRDAQGQLGNDAELAQRAIPVDVYGLTNNVASIDTGSSHACALLKSGGVLCWGNAASGQLGNGAAGVNKSTPDAVSGLSSGVKYLDVGGSHTCAVTTAGGVKCWGLDSSGQLGNDTNLVNQATPVDVLP